MARTNSREVPVSISTLMVKPHNGGWQEVEAELESETPEQEVMRLQQMFERLLGPGGNLGGAQATLHRLRSAELEWALQYVEGGIKRSRCFLAAAQRKLDKAKDRRREQQLH